MKTNIMNNLSGAFYKTCFTLRKHSPKILVVAGVVGVVTSAVMACKATTKAQEVLNNAKDEISKVHQVLEDETISEETYSSDDAKKDLAIVYAKTGLNFVKLYGPSVLLGAASIAAILTSNRILSRRNMALAAAYGTLNRQFKAYRGRLIDRFGADLDRELKYNITKKEVEEVVTSEDGTETTVKKTVNVFDPNSISDYARFFTDGCLGYTKDPELNLMILKRQQSYANDLLKTRGRAGVFLNEVYDMLGIPRTKAGQYVGWRYDEKNPTGDNFIDFGIYNGATGDNAKAFVNGLERSILLDFNVDGVIVDDEPDLALWSKIGYRAKGDPIYRY